MTDDDPTNISPDLPSSREAATTEDELTPSSEQAAIPRDPASELSDGDRPKPTFGSADETAGQPSDLALAPDGSEHDPENAAKLPIETLDAVFIEKGAGLPRRYLSHLDKEKRSAFESSETERALMILDDADPELKRLRFFVRVAHERFGGTFKQPALGFARRAISEDLRDSTFDSTDPAIDRLRSAADVLRSRIRRDGPDARRSLNVLMLAIEILAAGTPIAPEEVTPVLRHVVGVEELDAKPRNIRRARLANLTDPKLTRDRVRELLELLEPWEQDAASAREGALRATEAARVARERLASAEGETDALRARLRHLEQDLAEARQESARLSDQVRNAGAIGESDVRAAHARSLSLLEGKLRPLLDSAREAGDLDRTKVMRRFVGDVLREIDKEIEWLRSSD